jgi:chromatin segregation and condensation protein Rec8/ScpA/Scc1 (kleisin family)
LATLKKLLNELESLLRPTQAVKNEIISLKAKIEEILRRLTDQPLAFSSLHRKSSRSEIIVFFLAILYLIKEQLIHIEQKSHFDEIEIFKLNKRSE